MVNYKEILRLAAEGTSQRQIAASVRSSRNKVNEVILAAKAANIEWPPEESVSNEQLGAILFPNRHISENPYLEPDYARIHSELAKPKVTLTLLWDGPNVTDIVAIARACEQAGADGICLINTMLGMRIDVKCRKPIIANVMGGFSGAAIFPVAVRMVYQVARACRIPVMGCGGVETARDVIEMMMAGATAVQVGAANLRNPYACKEIVEALPREMERLGIERLSDIIGIVK